MSDVVIQWLVVFVDASVKAALVALVAAGGLALLRVRDSNLRHRVWTGVLCGMLLLPALTQVVPALRLPFTVNPEWFAALDRTDDGDAIVQITGRLGQDGENAAIEPIVGQQPTPRDLESMARRDGRALAGRPNWPDEFRGGSPKSLLPPDNALAGDPPNQPLAAAATASVEPKPANNNEPPVALRQPVSRVILSHLPLVFWSVWIAGSLVLGLRLLAGLWMARVLRSASRPIAPYELPSLITDAEPQVGGVLVCGAGVSPADAQARRLHHKDNDVHPEAHAHQNLFPSPLGGEWRVDLAQAAPIEHTMRQRSVPILACPLIRVPLTLGVLRPRVLLPPDWLDWPAEKLQAVLAHERTHAERGDCALALLAEVNRCVYWFHPLAWWLRGRLAALAEAACDDAAIGSTGDRARYARHLLEVAATARAHRGRLVAGSVSMARRSNVETRITAILDFTRPLSQRLTRGTAIVLVAAIVPLVALAAALRPSSGKIENSVPAAVALDETQPTNAEASESDVPGGASRDATSEAAVTNAEPVAIQDKRESTTAPRTDDSKPISEYSVLSTRPSAENKPDSSPASDATVTYRGRVLDPDGMPFAGATVYILGAYWSPDVKHVPLAEVKSGADGAFEISWQDPMRNQDVWHGRMSGEVQAIVAIANGFGPGFIGSDRMQRDEPLTLRLVRDDVPIAGQVLDLEGRPVTGAKVKVGGILAFKGDDLTEWLDSVRARESRYSGRNRFGQGHIPGYESAASLGAVTDADGRFRLTGVGRERASEVVLEGPTMARTEATIVTRKIPPMVETTGPDFTKRHTILGADCQITVMPTRPIVGTVRDAETGQPLAGVTIANSSWMAGVMGARLIRSVTDQQGGYRLAGLPKINGIEITAVPGDEQPFFAQEAQVPESTGLEPVTVDFEMHRGTWITGRVTDKATGEPVAARVYYAPFRTNEHAQQRTPEFGKDANIYASRDEHTTGPDGTYRVVGLPGRALVGAWSLLRPYRAGVGADAIEGLDKYGHFPTYHMQIGPKWPNSMVEINPPAGVESVTCDVQLDAGETVRVSVVDPAGQPLVGYTVEGSTAISNSPALHEQRPEFDATNLGPDEVRTILIQHETRKLGRVVQMRLDAHLNRAAQIKLEPLATVTGRLLTADGDPLAGVAMRFGVLPGGDFGKELRGAVTDKDGRFSYAVLSGCDYAVMAEGKAVLAAGLDYGFFVVRESLSVEPGATVDLGEVKVVPPKPTAKPPLDPPVNEGKKDAPAATSGTTDSPPASTGSSKSPSPSTGRAGVGALPGAPATKTISINGVVLKPDGTPAAGATVRAAAPLWAILEPIVGADFKSPMSETKTDAQGRFSISFPTQPFGDLGRLDERWREIWKKTTVAASLERFGPAWVTYEEIDPQQPATLRLVDDLPVRGRIVDLEGRPVAGASVKLSDLRAAAAGDDLSAWIDGIKAGELPWTVYDKARRFVDPRLIGLPGLLTTGADGTIELHGMGRERLVELTFEGDSVAQRSATLVTRKMDAIRRTISAPPFEGTVPVFGAEFTFTADPARPIEGVVRDAKSGELLGDVSVESEKLVGYPYSSSRVLKTKTDKRGRFRLIGTPKGSGNRLLLVPNDEQPYFMREVDVPDPVGLGPAKMQIELHRGIWITGRVSDKATGEPVPGVRLHYLPFRSNEYAQKTPGFDSDGNVDGDQMRYVTKADGTYRLVGLPGRAIVGAQSVLQHYCRGVGYDAINAPKYEKTDHFDTYRNPIDPSPKWPSVMREINPAVDAESVSLDLQLEPGQSLRIRVVSPGGEPLSGVSVTGLSSNSYLKASQEPILIAVNFGSGETRIVLFHHEERKIGRVVTIGPEQLRGGEMTVELQSCATLVGRILNSDGLPITGMEIRPDVLPSGDFSEELPSVATDSEGRFRVTLLPGCQYSFGGEGGGFQFVTVAKELSIEPGETKDLGTLTIDKDGKVARADRKEE